MDPAALLEEALSHSATISEIIFEAVHLATEHEDPQPYNNSIRTGLEWLDELMSETGHPQVFRDTFGVSKRVFMKLLEELESKGLLADGKLVTTQEQLSIFLRYARFGESVREMQPCLQGANLTITRYIYAVVNALLNPSMYSHYVGLPQASNPVPPKILNDPTQYPFFKDCLGALDGTHIQCHVSAEEAHMY
ncbi:hypothetical protein JCM16303_006044 [Sporobolomyces ruberrimus]